MIVDVNEGWQVEELARYANRLADYNIRFFEQSVPQAQQAALAAIDLPFAPMKAPMKALDIADLAKLYDWVNIKIDKTGGLTEALEMAATARRQGLNIMVGCMVATSLSMAPAHLVGQLADYVDLDGLLWLESAAKTVWPMKMVSFNRPNRPYGGNQMGIIGNGDWRLTIFIANDYY